MPHLPDINLNRLAIFVSVVETGSITAAAERLDLTKAVVSQHLARLEKELGVTLLTRTTRRMTLTEPGESFYTDCVELLRNAARAIDRLGDGQREPVGNLRLTTTVDYGVAVVVPAVVAFMARYPKVSVELIAADQVLDLVADGIDLSIRQGWPKSSSLQTVRLGSFEQWLVGAPAYLAARGTPQQPADLAAHRWIALSLLHAPLSWQFVTADGTPCPVKVSAALQVNSVRILQAFVVAGEGLSVLPDYMVRDDIAAGRLVRLLSDCSLPEPGIFAVTPDPRAPAKVRAFLEVLRSFLNPD